MSRRCSLGVAWIAVGILVAALCTSAIAQTPAAPQKPNVIFILADDLGYGDVGVTFQNARDPNLPRFPTPSLDHLAASGMLLRQHYTGAPVCAPARASLLLGQHQGNCPIRDNQFDKAMPDNHTLATVMKAAGYQTIAIGKWGLQGKAPEYTGHPLRHGFDQFFGYLAHLTGHVYYHDPKHPLEEGFNDVTAQYENIYSTDLFTARAKQYIIDHEQQSPRTPFFMYLAYTAPHDPQGLPGEDYPSGAGLHGGLQWPLMPTPKTKDKWLDPAYESRPWKPRMKRYATVVGRLDRAVGDVVQLLADLKIDRNTLVVFTSDNGPSEEGADPRWFDSWGPFDGFKRDIWEGGVREPTIAVWPGRIPAGQTSDAITAFWDWMPTLADVGGLAPPAASDGISLLPTLEGKGQPPPSRFIFEDYFFNNWSKHPEGALGDVMRRKDQTNRGVQQMIRQGNYVAVRTQVKSADDALRLYDVTADPHQDHDLSADPKFAPLLQTFRDELAWIRRPNESAARPYDNQPLPAVTVTVQSGSMSAAAYEGQWPWVPDFDALQPVRRSRVSTFDVPSLSLSRQGGIRFEGYLNVPADGIYTFWIDNDGGAEFWLHDARLIDDDFHHTGAAWSWVPLKAGLHPFRLFYRHASGTPKLRVEMAGPDLPRAPLTGNRIASSTEMMGDTHAR